MPWMAPAAASADFRFNHAKERHSLLELQRLALQYFLDNQSPRTGLVFDRQRNFGPFKNHGLWSSAATGMGLIAVALASASPHRLLARADAATRVKRALEFSLDSLPHTHGIMPHFIDSTSGEVVGNDARSTIDSAWLIAGGLWAATFLRDATLQRLGARLFERVDWRYWTASSGLLGHGADGRARKLPCSWDRLNGETVFLYVLAAGAEADRAWPAANWRKLGAFVGETAGQRFGSADLGLFVFQYGLDLLDLHDWILPCGRDLMADALMATDANAGFCRDAADRFQTFTRYWGLSAGDGPGEHASEDTYRCYAPGEALDGTAHLSATLPMLVHRPTLVWENLRQADAERDLSPRGRYGYSCINLDRQWVSRDVVGIDAGAVVMALDNCLANNRVRRTFHAIQAVQSGLQRVGCYPRPAARQAA